VYKTSEQAGLKLFRILALTVFVVGIIYGVTALSPDIKGRFAEDQTAKIRVIMAQSSVNLIADNPLFGVGQGKFDEAVERYLFDMRGAYVGADTSHVTILTILAELGLLGGVLWVLMIALNLRHSGIRLAELTKEDQLIVWVFLGNVVAWVINSLLIDMRWSMIGYTLLFISLGFIQNIFRDNYAMKLERV
jgi:O-antigen ligase